MLVQAVSAVVTTNRAKKYQARLTGLLLAGRLRRHGPANARPERRPDPVQRTGRMENDQDGAGSVGTQRSEEHTSELQSRGHLVCRLLLEKKKNIELHTGTLYPYMEGLYTSAPRIN